MELRFNDGVWLMLGCVTQIVLFRIKTLITCQEFQLWPFTYMFLSAGESCLTKAIPLPMDEGSQHWQRWGTRAFTLASVLDLSKRPFQLQSTPCGRLWSLLLMCYSSISLSASRTLSQVVFPRVALLNVRHTQLHLRVHFSGVQVMTGWFLKTAFTGVIFCVYIYIINWSKNYHHKFPSPEPNLHRRECSYFIMFLISSCWLGPIRKKKKNSHIYLYKWFFLLSRSGLCQMSRGQHSVKVEINFLSFFVVMRVYSIHINWFEKTFSSCLFSTSIIFIEQQCYSTWIIFALFVGLYNSLSKIHFVPGLFYTSP